MADPGKLCVYLAASQFFDDSTTITVINPVAGGAVAGTSSAGAVLKVNCAAAVCAQLKGTWAVTG